MTQTPIQTAFTEIKTRLLRITRSFLPCDEDAEDAVQETFCRLWQIKDNIRTQQEATALAIKTAKNICIDQLRRDQIVEFNKLDNWTEGSNERILEKEIEARDEFRIVQIMIEQRLTPLQQKVLKMREIEGLDFKEIADELKMEETAVRMNLSRAKKEIRELYNQLNP